jgi:NAD(P)-dependent dehydrogenase (short-subunit alcohol dehydrogenase family)
VERTMTTVLITGANRGIGLALARLYLARGDTLIATVRDPARADALQALGDASGGRLTVVSADVTDAATLAAAAAAIAARPVDLLVCNAGVLSGRGGLDDPANTPAEWNALFATNVTGAMSTVKAFLPNVTLAKGRIAFISSRMGSSSRAFGNSYAYRASKAAVSNFALNLAQDLKPEGIAVASYHPGWVKTDMGGSGAEIDVETAARGLVARFDRLSMTNTGAFESYDGTGVPY